MWRAVRKHTLIVAALTGVLAVVCAASVLRLSWYRITSHSMEPDFPVGTIVITSGALQPRLHHPVTFQADGAIVTHVLVGYNRDGSLITRGTTNKANDVWRTPVYPRDVHGRVIAQVVAFVPSFWLSVRGMAAIVVFVFLVIGLVWARVTTRAYTGVRSSAYSQTESSA